MGVKMQRRAIWTKHFHIKIFVLVFIHRHNDLIHITTYKLT